MRAHTGSMWLANGRVCSSAGGSCETPLQGGVVGGGIDEDPARTSQGAAGGGSGVGWCARGLGLVGWWRAPSAGEGSRGVNALWARRQCVGQGHSDGEYRASADTLRRGEISDVFFHVG